MSKIAGEVAITNGLIIKMHSITQDIKVYMNMSISLAKSGSGHPLMDQTDVDEMIKMRTTMKAITRRMEEKNSFSTKAKYNTANNSK